MVIGVCGLGYTGSGAVMDLLKEYNDVQVQDDYEFGLAYRPDGLEDLAYHLENPSRYMSSDVAIQRFKSYVEYLFRKGLNWGGIDNTKEIYQLTIKYIDSICQVKWQGYWGTDVYNSSKLKYIWKWHICNRLIRKYENKKKEHYRKYPCREMYLSCNPENFEVMTKKYVSEIFKLMGYDDDKLLVVNQAFSGDNPVKSFRFFNNPKAIIVDKDPRDLYVLCKKEVISDCKWVPTDSVDDFIVYYKSIRQGYRYLNNEKVLLIKFEDLIYEYEDTVSKIEKFVGIDSSQHISKRSYFDFDKSIENTQLFRKYESMENDIKKIESGLKEYLFPYEKYEVKNTFGKAF